MTTEPATILRPARGTTRSSGDRRWPIHRCTTVFHVGEMDPALKGRTHNATSHEGNGLSVSVHPAYWRRIARLGDAPLWKLRAPASRGDEIVGAFLDALALRPWHWDAVAGWAAQVGFTTSCEAFEVSWIGDDEPASRRYMLFDTADPRSARAARLEFEGVIDNDPQLKRVQVQKATPAMDRRLGFHADMPLVRDLALTLFVEDVLFSTHGLQGVWWKDHLDPAGLSAPRGVIHLSALSAWAAERETYGSRAAERAESNCLYAIQPTLDHPRPDRQRSR